MFGYISLGTNDLPRARAVFQPLMEAMGQKEIVSFKVASFYGTRPDAPMLMVTRPENREDATIGNGVMIALALPTQQEVDRMHALALELGATNEGDPGVRPQGLYCAYFRDPDGNKFNFHAPGS